MLSLRNENLFSKWFLLIRTKLPKPVIHTIYQGKKIFTFIIGFRSQALYTREHECMPIITFEIVQLQKTALFQYQLIKSILIVTLE